MHEQSETTLRAIWDWESAQIPIIESVGAHLDGRLIKPEPWFVSSESDVDDLINLLHNPARDAEVIVFALPEGSTNPNETAASAIDVHRKTLGAAHVVILAGPASFHLSDRVSKEFSVFRQAVRTYLPGFSPTQDEPFRHPLSMPARIVSWPDGGPSAYVKMLVSQSLARSISKPDREQRLPSFAAIRRLAAQQTLDKARISGSSEKDFLKLALEEITQMRKSFEEEKKNNDALLSTADRERQEAEQAALQAKARSGIQQKRIEALQLQLEEMGQQAAKVPIPDNLDELSTWCQKYLGGAVDIHNRAYQGAKKSLYQNSSFIYEILLLLRDFYVPMRRQGGDDLKHAYEAECHRLGVEESNTISRERLGEQGETYIVNYGGKRRTLDRHLKNGGTSKDQRICFRLYFFWDEDSEQVVVGWLPSHLDTRQT